MVLRAGQMLVALVAGLLPAAAAAQVFEWDGIRADQPNAEFIASCGPNPYPRIKADKMCGKGGATIQASGYTVQLLKSPLFYFQGNKLVRWELIYYAKGFNFMYVGLELNRRFGRPCEEKVKPSDPDSAYYWQLHPTYVWCLAGGKLYQNDSGNDDDFKSVVYVSD